MRTLTVAFWGDGNRTVATKSDEKATVGDGNYFSVTPFASIDNTSFCLFLVDGVTVAKG